MPCSTSWGLVFLLKLIGAFLLRNIYLCHLPDGTNTDLPCVSFFSLPLFNQIPVRYFTGMTDTVLQCCCFFVLTLQPDTSPLFHRYDRQRPSVFFCVFSFSLFNQILLRYFTGMTVLFSIAFLLELCLERWCQKQIKELLGRPPVVFFHCCCTPSLYLARPSQTAHFCTHAIPVNTQPHCLTVT